MSACGHPVACATHPAASSLVRHFEVPLEKVPRLRLSMQGRHPSRPPSNGPPPVHHLHLHPTRPPPLPHSARGWRSVATVERWHRTKAAHSSPPPPPTPSRPAAARAVTASTLRWMPCEACLPTPLPPCTHHPGARQLGTGVRRSAPTPRGTNFGAQRWWAAPVGRGRGGWGECPRARLTASP